MADTKAKEAKISVKVIIDKVNRIVVYAEAKISINAAKIKNSLGLRMLKASLRSCSALTNSLNILIR
ncbi:hypothetical protein Hanom_Chr14g01300631 [Helianthus anomalus]